MDDTIISLSRVFDYAPFGVCAFDSDGRIVFANSKFNSDVSKAGEDLVGTIIFDRLPRLRLDYELFRKIRDLIDKKTPFTTVIETFSSPMFSETGLFHITGYSIEPYHIMTNQLAGSDLGQDKRFRNLILDAPDVILLLNKGIISFCNKAFTDVLGIPMAEAIGKDFSVFLNHGDGNTLSEINHNKAPAFSVQFSIDTPSGRKTLDGRFHSVDDSQGLSLAVLRDVTEKVALEQRIIRQNEDLSAINSISETLSSSINMHDVISRVLEKVLEIMNIETGLIFLLDERTNTLRCVHSYGLPDYIVESLKELKFGEGIAGRVAATGEPIIISNASEDIRITSVAFRRYGIKTFASIPIRSRTRLLGVMNIGAYGKRDITADDRQLLLSVGLHMGAVLENIILFNEVEKATEDLKNAMMTIEHRNEDLKRIVYTVSHDLKNPIIAINGFAARLMKTMSDKLSEKERIYLNAIKESGQHMECFVNDLLNYSVAENYRLEEERLDVGDVIERIIVELEPQIEAKSGKVVIDNDMPVITTDRARLIQVFSNLISNAIKYSHPDRQPLINIGYRPKAEMHIFYVKDNGIGIPSEYLENVFDMFFRTYEDLATGTGLGLSIVKKAVNDMKGDIWIESEKNKGSVFYFSLPEKNIPSS
jgi:signal transduction histidine kinase/PAS domain-containing protein